MKKILSLLIAMMMFTSLFAFDCFTASADEICPRCSGSGSTMCLNCMGSGTVTQNLLNYDPISLTYVNRTIMVGCSSCGGSGRVVCTKCGGTGRVGSSGNSNDSSSDSSSSAAALKNNGAYDYTEGVVSDENGPCLFDGKTETKYNIYASSGYICWESKNVIKVKSYTMTTANDTSLYKGRNPKSWILYGSNRKLSAESKDWKVIHKVTNDTKLKAVDFTKFTFKLKKPSKAYKYFKFQILDNKGDTCTQLSELKLNGKKITAKKTELISVKRKGKNAVVKWKKQKGIKGYQIIYGTSAKLKDGKTVELTKAKKVKQTVKSLNKGKTYYFKVRTFKVVNGIKIYSKWSNKKSVKI